MATYNYTARSSKGEIIKDSIDGEAEDLVVSKIKDMGYFIVNITKLKEDKVKMKLPALKIFTRVKTRDIVIFTRQFATMISAGMSLIEVLAILGKQTANPKLAAILSEIKTDVETGHTLSESMEKHSSVFPEVYISLVRAGEAGGVLDKTMNDLANFLEKEENIRATISSKTAYPKFVLVFAIIITVVIIVFLVPTFQEIYESMGAELPTITQIVISIGDLLKKVYFYVILAVIIFGGRYLFKKILKSSRGRYLLDKLKISIPRVGDLFKKMSLSRFNRHFGILLATGVPILNSLEITKGVAGNVLIDNALDKVRKSIKEGENIAEPMSRMKVFPTMMVQMIAVGEKTGTLDEVVSKLADFYENEVTHSVDSLVTILEPLMLLFVAGIIGMIVLSMYLPMFTMYQNI